MVRAHTHTHKEAAFRENIFMEALESPLILILNIGKTKSDKLIFYMEFSIYTFPEIFCAK